jgi:hypothetical protein
VINAAPDQLAVRTNARTSEGTTLSDATRLALDRTRMAADRTLLAHDVAFSS